MLKPLCLCTLFLEDLQLSSVLKDHKLKRPASSISIRLTVQQLQDAIGQDLGRAGSGQRLNISEAYTILLWAACTDNQCRIGFYCLSAGAIPDLETLVAKYPNASRTEVLRCNL